MAVAESVTVYNPEDLKQAVADGAEDIVLANHLDVSSAAAGGYADFLLDVQPTTRSIRGVCQHPPPGGFLPRYSPAAPRQPSQCVLVATSDLLRVNNPEAQIWLHGLFVRVARQAPNATHPRLVTLHSGSLWATQVTLDGFRQPALAALVDTGARAYFEMLTVANFVVPEGEAVAPLMHAKGAIALTDSAFANNSLPGTAAGAVFVSGAGALRLERTAFIGTTSDHAVLAATPRNAVYSDNSAATYAVLAQGAGTPGVPGGGRSVQTRPTRVLSAARGEPFLFGNDTWLLELQQELRLQPSDPGGPDGGGGGGGSDRDTTGALMFVGLAAAAIVGLAICCVACVCLRRRCSRLGQKDSIDSEPDFWTSNGIASQKDLFSGDPLNTVRKGPVFGMSSRDGRLTTYPSRVMRNTRLPPEAARLPAVPEDTRLGGMGTESSILSRDSSINSSSSRPWAWW